MTVIPLKRAPGECRMIAKGNKSAEIWIYGDIGKDWFSDGVSADDFAKNLRGLGDVNQIDLRINSDGGVVFEARSMYNLLIEHKAQITVHIDGIAASAASVVAMAGNKIMIAEGAFIMIHNAHGFVGGEAKDMKKYASLLELVNGSIRDTYVARTGKSVEQVEAWMDEETWFTGEEAIANGFADEIVPNRSAVAARVSNPTRFQKLPAALKRPLLDELRALSARR